MQFTIAGNGNMAWFLGQKLIQSGHTCNGIYGRNKAAVTALAGALQANVLDNIQELTKADVCIIAVTDTGIPEIGAQLHNTKAVLIHTSGTTATSALGNTSENTGVLWPVYSILKTGFPQHRDIPVAWEANTEHAGQIIQEIIKSFSDKAFPANTTQRQWLHLTAVIANNFTNHLVALCEEICTEQQLPYDILLPILRQTFERVMTVPAKNVQTGPAKRGDLPTIERHLNMLSAHPEWHQLYKSITASIENMYQQGHTETDLNR
ncbi:Rossmann-like and DUF2520 domain-containing protein [Taibaiella soli]|uniref:DUF2520 domain-containing protein n=1 Tax=Taibaiella soli TaxID=1649169 RepID=A0A2W2A7K0_9BACT|nr:Rossmann-like and DUF2520 domain-containing protein [Taibaiella soli]PZF71221.1 hypothetical protein DN068_19810 [Taibaiella soli]